ncbi:hypothetical protein BLNAU_10225 [Blattamonas nauphoetae]|uniref:Uncharacterized protein n=1 Tax=Blattamonas nauphoetae TaxID=2049346 RepID=A0ABQ9XTU9_9EUKA|nr:hypothetical protein BLNAU_10225 [Blattamonas nauphoetae]
MRQFVERQVQRTQVRQQFEVKMQKLGNPVIRKRKCVQFSKLRNMQRHRGQQVRLKQQTLQRTENDARMRPCPQDPRIKETTQLLGTSPDQLGAMSICCVTGCEIEGGMLASESNETSNVCKFDSVKKTIREISQQIVSKQETRYGGCEQYDYGKYSPFLTWNENDPLTVDSVSAVFVSLVAMVRDDYNFDEEQLKQASTFFSSITRRATPGTFFESFLKTIGEDPADSIPPFLDSTIILLSSPHPSIFRDTLSFLHHCLRGCSPSNHLAFLSAKLFSRMLSTPFLRDLSAINDQGIVKDTIEMLEWCIQLTSTDSLQSLSTTLHTDPQSIRDLMLYEVVIPVEPVLVQINQNHHLFSLHDGYLTTLKLFVKIFDLGAFHQPTLDFICSSRIPMVFQSLLSKIEHEETHHVIYLFMSGNISIWKYRGAETWCRGRILLQTLEREGFIDELEQSLLHIKTKPHGNTVRQACSSLAFIQSRTKVYGHPAPRRTGDLSKERNQSVLTGGTDYTHHISSSRKRRHFVMAAIGCASQGTSVEHLDFHFTTLI